MRAVCLKQWTFTRFVEYLNYYPTFHNISDTSNVKTTEENPNFLLINLPSPLTISVPWKGEKGSRGRRSRCAKFKVPSGQKGKWKEKNFCCISTTSRHFRVASFTLSNHGRSTFSLSRYGWGNKKKTRPILLDVCQNHDADSHANLLSVSRIRLSDPLCSLSWRTLNRYDYWSCERRSWKNAPLFRLADMYVRIFVAISGARTS